MIFKTIRRKSKIEQIKPTKNWVELSCSGSDSNSCSTSDISEKDINRFWYKSKSQIIF